MGGTWETGYPLFVYPGSANGGAVRTRPCSVSCSRPLPQRGQCECVWLVPMLVQLRLLCVRP